MNTTRNTVTSTAAVQQGTIGNDIFPGTPNDDNYQGLAGDDVLNGILGNDSLDGGDGNDRLYGNEGDDTLVGGFGDDYLSGDAGNNTLLGGAGDDTLVGDLGINLLQGEDGDDTYHVFSLENTIVETTGNDWVVASINWTLGENLENLGLLKSAGAANATGNSLNNILYGNDSNNTLKGLEGNDILVAKLGNDTLYGDAGDDILFGGSRDGNDRFYGGQGRDTFVLQRNKAKQLNFVQDFRDGQDKLGLIPGVKFNQLTIEVADFNIGGKAEDTLIKYGNQRLSVLIDVRPNQITQADSQIVNNTFSIPVDL